MASPEQPLGLFARWMRQPKSTWIRAAMFQVHLWAGMLLGVYAVVVCVSGSALVFRNDIYDLFERWDKAGTISQHSTPIRAVYMALAWLGEVHGKLLLGVNGMTVNAVGGFLTAALCFTGLVIWWPGITRWKRGLIVKGIVTGRVSWRRLNFDLHSAVGFWTFGLLVMWGLTGGYFVFPQPFRAVINTFTPIDAPALPRANNAVAPQPIGVTRASSQVSGVSLNALPNRAAPQSVTAPQTAAAAQTVTAAPRPFLRRPRRPLTRGGKILQWFSFLHYGNFGGWPLKALWVLLGLTPAVLFGTALVMWWSRVLSPARRRSKRGWAEAPASVTPKLEWERE